ncbi:Ig-like domain repeat protein [Tessaracoccus antarcticus]|uniref:Ig-like domain repeat protein n=1 Tax=Tessaracoccus antarcticus TaxID=2479848 RepID=A0A3M0GVZ6_9ACTN|nr:Ig-like domain repeat protein [Tessaracoccus antarcticus]RMB61516.1 Ig-like domain repeat protein [Tessaracoccus antarcticus]
MTTDTRGVRGTTRRSVASLSAVMLALGWWTLGTSPALADGSTTVANTTSIDIPAAGSVNQLGPANPYPSSIPVAGLGGLVTNVTVTFTNLTHGSVGDIDAMLVAPSGETLVVMSDVGDPSGEFPGAQLVTANNVNLTFSDSAAGPVPRVFILPGGTYKPTNTGAGDAFPAPAPTPSNATTLAGAFTGINPNGSWQLFAVDDVSGETGTMAGGWSLTITTATSAVATSTAVVTSGTPTTTGDPVTFTASVTAGGTPATGGSVQFSDGSSNLGAPVALNASGQASLTTSALSEGTHDIRATFSGAAGFLTSNGAVAQRVDNATVVTGNTFCNAGTITVPSVGAAQPYPSNITVFGLSGTITKVTASLKGLSHQAPIDLDVLLSGPAPSTNLFLLSDTGGFNPVSNVDVTLDDAAPAGVSAPLVSGTFRPTNADDGSNDVMPTPAPAPSSATGFSTFNGSAPNGTWSLSVVDDASGDSGSIAGGWCVTVTTQAATTTVLSAAPSPSIPGQPVTFTAAVDAGATTVSEGSVSFNLDGAVVDAAVNLVAGHATWTTSTLTAGTHTVVATYSGTASYGSSSDDLDQSVNPAADAGGPYTVGEGAEVTLDGSGSSPGMTYTWDVNGDGVFGDASGSSPTLTWAELESMGIDDGPMVRAVMVRVSQGGLTTDSAATTLTVENAAPSVAITGSLAATVGLPFSLVLGAADPSSVDMAAQFTFTITWGDGSAIATVVGPAGQSVTHTYMASGPRTVSVTATDKDGGKGSPASAEVTVATAPSPSPTPPPSPKPSPSPSASPSPSPSVTSGSGPTDLYSTPGYHDVNGRTWFTTCEPYSQTLRCRTSIWATQVSYVNGAFRSSTGWYFNNLTYLPSMKRSQWAGNPLGHAGEWTSTQGRMWRTECDTLATGGNGCRSFIRARYIVSSVDARGNRAFQWTHGWLFNSMVRFRQ